MNKLNLGIEYVAADLLRPHPGNARTHSKKQITQIAASIKQFGMISPILVDDSNTIIAGHGRVLASKQLGQNVVPVVRVEHLSEAEKRAYMIADNRLAELAGWDREILAIEFQHLDGLDLDFNLEITGFDTAELDLMLDPLAPKEDPADALPPIEEIAVTRRGDIWHLGDHRLICGDARSAETYVELMGTEKARMAFSDPPYNVKIENNVSGLGKTKHREFVVASGEMSQADFIALLAESMIHVAAHSLEGAISYWCMDWRHMDEMSAAGRKAELELKNLIVWNKTNAGMGTFYRSQHELIYVFKRQGGAHLNNFGLGETGRWRSNVWVYPGVNTFKKDRDKELAAHPTVKPVALVADALKDVSRRGEIVIDAFAGSGTTAIAAEKTRRKARLIELDELYCDLICRRFATFTGKVALHAQTGQTFDEVAATRLGSSSDQPQ